MNKDRNGVQASPPAGDGGIVPPVTRQTEKILDHTQSPLFTELLLLADGQILAHNLTPAFAELLKALNPADEQIAARARSNPEPASRSPHPESQPPLPTP